MAKRSILGLVYTVKTFEANEIPIRDILQRHGIDLNKLDPFALIDRSNELAILTEIAGRCTDPYIGIKLGHSFGLAGYGPFAMLLQTCSNAFEACKTGIQYQNIAYVYGELRLELGQPHSALSIYPHRLPEPVARMIIDRDLVGTLRLIKDIGISVNKSLTVQEAWLPYPSPESIEPYETALGCPVYFDKPCARLVMPTDYLQHPFPQASTMAFDYYKSQCDQILLKSSENSEHLSDAIRHYLALFVYEIPSINTVCSAFELSERTLRRRLQEEGCSYQKLLNEMRFNKAKTYLKTQLPIEEIAARLGYQEPAAFNHAFQRWAGQSPSRYRQTVTSS